MNYYLLDVRAWIDLDNKRDLNDTKAIVYCVEQSLKDAEKQLKEGFNDAMIVDDDWNYVPSNCYTEFEDLRYAIRRNHFIGRDPVLDKKEGTDNIEVLTFNDLFTEDELDNLEKDSNRRQLRKRTSE